MLDNPEFLKSVGNVLKPTMFSQLEHQWVVAEILNAYEEHGTVNRQMLLDKLIESFSETDPYEPILETINRKSDTRGVPIIMNPWKPILDDLTNKYTHLYKSHQELQRKLDPNLMKIKVCEYLLSLKEDSFIPPTSIDWLGNGIVRALLAETSTHDNQQ
jgi:hypothetical protein